MELSSSKSQIWKDPSVITLAVLQFFITGAYAIQLASLELFLTGHLHLHNAQSFAIITFFVSPMLLLPLLTGYIGDRFIGHYNATMLALFMVLIGLVLFAIHPNVTYLIALAFIQCGINLLAPNLYVLVGRRFPSEGAYRDSAFSINYAGMNAGAFVCIFASGFIIKDLGYPILYAFSAILVIFSIAIMIIFRRFIYNQTEIKLSIKFLALTVLIMAATVVISYFLLMHAKDANLLLILSGLISFALLLFLINKTKGVVRQKISTFLILSVLCVGFISFFYLTPTLILTFVEHNVHHLLFGFYIPTQSLYAFAPAFVTLFALLAGQIWIYLKRQKHEMHIPTKIFLGLIFLGASYLLLFIGTISADSLGKVALFWIIIFYAFHSLAEVSILPSGYSMVGVLAPQKFEGVFQGVWALTLGLAAGISSIIARMSVASETAKPLVSTPYYGHAYITYTLLLLVFASITFILIPRLTKVFVAKG